MRVRSLLPLALAGCLAPLAAAQEGAAPPPAGPEPETVWVVELAGREIGRERARVHERGGERRLVSEASVALTETPFTYRQELVLAADTGALTSYTLTSDVVEASALRTAQGVELRVRYGGEEVARGHPAPEPTLVLDNLVFAHFAELGRRAAQEGAFEFTALVPQSAAALAARLEPREQVTGRLGGAPLTVRRAALTVGNLALEVWYAADGRVVAVEVPSQRLAAHVEGWAPPAAAEAPAPAAAREVEVAVPSPDGELAGLGGVLTLPAQGAGPWPTVLFLAGSGPQDRDETIGPNKPLRDLARALAAQGVASLRYDKRPHQLAQALRAGGEERARARERLERFTLRDEYVLDAVAALRWLSSREEVGPLVLAGHSLGGVAAPDVVSALAGEPRLAGVALLATPGRPFLELLREQMLYQASLQGQDAAAAREGVAAQLAPLERIAAGEEPGVKMVLGASVSYWADVLPRDPAAAVAALPLPVLLLQGGKDCQVTPADFERLREARADRPGAPPTSARLFPELNHLFMPVDGPRSTGAEYALEGKVDPAVAEALATWARALPRE